MNSIILLVLQVAAAACAEIVVFSSLPWGRIGAAAGPSNLQFIVPALSAGLAALVVTAVGAGGAKLARRPFPRFANFGAALLAAAIFAGLIHVIAQLALPDLSRFVPPYLVFGAVAAGGYQAAESDLPFDPILPLAFLFGIEGAAAGAMAGAMILSLGLPSGSYPRLMLAIPLVAGGFVGLAAGSGLAHLVRLMFKRRV